MQRRLNLEVSFGHKHFNQTLLVFWVTSVSVSSSSSPLRARTAACTSAIIPPPESVLSYLGPQDRILAVWLLWCWCRNPLPLVSCGTGGHNCRGPLGVAGHGCWDRIGLSLSGSLSRGFSLKCSRLDTKLVYLSIVSNHNIQIIQDNYTIIPVKLLHVTQRFTNNTNARPTI